MFSSKTFSAYPKIFSLGTDYIRDIFDGEVEITEKVDGSQFSVGRINDELIMRSKGKQIFPEACGPKDMFYPIVNYMLSIEDKFSEGIIYYGEYLRKNRHNVLCYERIPKNFYTVFGVSDSTRTKFTSNYNMLLAYANLIDVDVVPLLHRGKVDSIEELMNFLERDSYLGGIKIEGVVVKNYDKAFLLGDQPIPLMAGKLVSEKFKEVHRSTWGKENTGKGKWETFMEGYRTDARWDKSIQHLTESNELSFEPKDIGLLIREIQRDIIEEEQDIIKEFLWKEFSQQLLRKAVSQFPEYYKEYLAKRSFE